MQLRIEDVIIRKVITIDSEASAQDATNKMKQYSTSCLVVLSENRIDGILTTRDLISRVVARGLEPGKVRVTDIATRPVIMMRPETPLEDAIKIMLQRKIKKIPLISGDKDNARLYGLLSLGWLGSQNQWRHYGSAYLFFAAFATPLVISVHSVVSWDFALAIVPGWHSTIFAPYFVAGAIHSGLAMVLILLIPLRRIFRFENLITLPILENIAKTIVFTGLIVGYAYGVEYFTAWYSGNMVERDTFIWRAIGEYAPQFWIMVLFNSVLPLAFFFKKVRTTLGSLFGIAILVNIGMWFERYVIIVGSVAHEYDPYSWGLYSPSWVEFGILLGSFGLFFFLFLLFVKFLPSISMTEVKEHLAPPVRGR